ncbi:ApeA N-terminal domain 1-containing protein [Vibrio splendidus]|uniref:ApeA N-terminal domain 1-containing protein n=1 Tax=Vibrio splendidus TaxID=29497 RepID=UPI000D3BD4F8|nr:HEPN domain-containing protein [Vibrio splendidus]PTP10069.1 hypothetical protein CWN86_00015 [Vibrio splendidus]PTP26533.1 hypothetical protein CWN85_02360 [Vibrio splendidus]PTP68673.1 hypothetical protein CWO31_04655 [Vibrio splendidus]
MRIEEELKLAGYFWLPSSPNKQIPGNLSILDGGKIELEIIGLFDELPEEFNEIINIDRVVGHVEKLGYVTLDKCFYKKKNLPFQGIAKSLLHVHRAFEGVGLVDGYEPLFSSFRFSIDGLDEWVGRSGIKVEQLYEERSANITYKQLEETSINLLNGMKLSISFSWKLPGFPVLSEAKITQRTFLRLESSDKVPLGDFISLAHKITTLVSFAVDNNVSLNSVYATIADDSDKKDAVRVIYQSLPYSKDKPKIEWHNMLFRFGQFGDNAELMINNWLEAYENIDPSLNLYFSTKTGVYKYLDGKFLALAQGLETYHRRTSNETLMPEDEFNDLIGHIVGSCPDEHKKWLSGRLMHGNEINLGKRIKSIISPFKDTIGTSRERNKFIRKIVDTRNYLTHYNEALKDSYPTGKELWLLCNKMEAIFQLHFLQVIGFSNNEIKNIIINNNKLRDKVSKI